ncbi:MAG: hypothetical protein IT374_00705, partial [Polyangiaceae bacterium]|nr:hypothetical protein [Polyangiaceae bacterium]
RAVDPRAARASLALLGAAPAAFVAVEAASGTWRVHAGELFPYRHLPGVPLAPTRWLAVEWALALLSAALLASGRRVAWATRLAAAVACLSITQRYTNGRALLCIALVSLALAPPVEARSPAFGLLRAQLLLVYGMSVVHKLREGFLSSPGVARLMGLDPSVDAAAGALVLAAEVATPAALVLAPRAGLALALGMHAAFTVYLPFVAPFSLVSLALACLFVTPRGVATTSA